jgi:hypothetical protein
MKSKRLLGCVLATLVIVLTPLVTTATADRSSGTWKMNSAKSKYNPDNTSRKRFQRSDQIRHLPSLVGRYGQHSDGFHR